MDSDKGYVNLINESEMKDVSSLEIQIQKKRNENKNKIVV